MAQHKKRKLQNKKWYHFIKFIFFFIIKLQSTIHLNPNILNKKNWKLKQTVRRISQKFIFIFRSFLFINQHIFNLRQQLWQVSTYIISLVKREFFEFYWTITKEYQWIMMLILFIYLFFLWNFVEFFICENLVN